MKNIKPRPHERGFILISVYAALIFLTVFSFAFYARHAGAIQITERYQNKIFAFNAAEAGIDFALRELATDPARRASTTATTYTSSYNALNQAGFLYTIAPVCTTTEPITCNPIMRRIDATGCAPDCTDSSRARQTSTITVYSSITAPTPPPGLFEYGIYTTQSINLSGSTFDSYNSAQGGYGGSNISSDGAIAANSTAIGAASFSNTTVKGSALISENGNPTTGISLTNSTLTGSKGTLPTGWTLGSPPPIESLDPPPTEIDLSNITQKKTLAAGTYHTSSVGISGNKGELVTTGAVKIYVDGGLNITGQGTTAAFNKPGNLQFYVSGSVSLKVRGNGAFYGAIYAPNSDVTFQTSNSGKGGTWFGAVVAKTFSSYGGGAPAFHFDLALREDSVPDPNQTQIVRITAWQENNSLAWGTGS